MNNKRKGIFFIGIGILCLIKTALNFLTVPSVWDLFAFACFACYPILGIHYMKNRCTCEDEPERLEGDGDASLEDEEEEDEPTSNKQFILLFMLIITPNLLAMFSKHPHRNFLSVPLYCFNIWFTIRTLRESCPCKDEYEEE